MNKKILGINGLGRIGKLTLWHHISRKFFNKIVVNIGRNVGTSLKDAAHYIERDSSYGSLRAYLYGCKAPEPIEDIDEKTSCIIIDGIKIHILREHRNPMQIKWAENNVNLVVDTTGQFLDPTLEAEVPKGSIRGHLKAGASKVIVSAPFKIKDQSKTMPKDAVTTVMGINDSAYDPRKHKIISNASCTTTCLAHIIKPLLNKFGAKKILSASMATIHAATGSQKVLDRLPKTGALDLRKNRSILNNIILTTTGAAKTLALVIPEMQNIGFIAESVRIPTSTGSLVILVVNLQEEASGGTIRRETINNIYRETAERDAHGYLQFTEKQYVSSDIIGLPRAAALIEGNETHTRTAEVGIDLQKVIGISKEILDQIDTSLITIPITQVVVYGWYDNELGSYVNMLGDRTVSVAENL
ncbi:glyceraldehyde 3-phosphate dehydrogenase [Candidatus Magnetomoraceae bacterium gMMP-15]